MTPTQIQHVLDKIAKCFPRSVLTEDEMQLFGERLDRVDLSTEQADRVVEQHRMEHDKRSPALSVLLTKLHAATQAKPEKQSGGKPGTRLVDYYRRRDKVPAHVSDLALAKWKARQVASDWGEGGARNHLMEMLRELKDIDLIECWRIAFEMFPNAAEQKRVREQMVRVVNRIAEMHKRASSRVQEAATA